MEVFVLIFKNKHRYSEGRGWCLLLSSVCSALTLRSQSQLRSLSTSLLADASKHHTVLLCS